MRRWTDLLRSKGFYIALGTGIIAFASLIVMYTNSNPGKDVTKEQAIDLNQSEITEETDNKDDSSSIAANTDPKKKETTETENKDEDEDDTEDTTEEMVASEETTESDNGAVDEINNTVDVASDVAQAASKYNGEDPIAWPVPGNIIMPFSMDTTIYFQTLDTYKCNPGIMIESSEGTNVCAVYDGVVESIKDTKEYGTVMTIDMGNGYKAIYGQLMNIRVREGDAVGVNQIIAEIAPVSAYYVEEGCNLFFEMTKDGEAINPMAYMQ
ncbi:MAG: peptidoglycan DD-metalloendopeptidase family protein [Wujia sp.]